MMARFWTNYTSMLAERRPFLGIDRKRLAGFIAALILVLIATKMLFQLIFWQASGPISLAIGLALVWLWIKKPAHNVSWRVLGMGGFRWYHTTGWFFIALVLAGFVIVGADALADQFFDKVPRSNPRFGDLEGNLPLTLAWISVGILIGGFAEEMVYRGFMINALERIFGEWRKWAVIPAIVLPALFWAARHFYFAGGHGAIVVFCIGLFFGIVYVLNGRNLWPTILIHALFDTLSFSMRYFGE
jgi:membrane protease YdiL (CAAX protease family)